MQTKRNDCIKRDIRKPVTAPSGQFILHMKYDVDSITIITQAHGVLHCKLSDTNEPITEIILRYSDISRSAPAGKHHKDEVIVNLRSF